MSNDLNLCQFIGRLGKDPVPRYSQSGTATVQISIAVGENWKDKATGEKKERTTWVPVVAFGRLAEIIAEFAGKGSRIYVAGKFSVRQWEKDGQKQYTTEVVASDMQLLDSRSSDAGRSGGDSKPREQLAAVQAWIDELGEDDIPFNSAPVTKNVRG